MIDRAQILALPLFEGLEGEELSVALAAFRSFEIGPGEVLMEEGEPDRSMMVVVDGELSVSLGGVELARIGPGEVVGEMAMFGTFDRRSATIRTLGTATALLILDEDALRFLRVQDNPMARSLESVALQTVAHRLRELDFVIAQTAEGQEELPRPKGGIFGRLATAFGANRPAGAPPAAIEVLRATSGFSGRDPVVLQNIASRLQVVMAGANQPIIEEGTSGDDAFILAEGKVGVFCRTMSGKVQRVAVLGPGHIFGHVSLTDTRVRTATCTALEPVYLLRIPGAVFRHFLTEQTPEGRAFRRGVIDALSSQLRLANEHLLAMVLRSGMGAEG